MTSRGKESKRVDICICVTASLLCTQSQQNIINQLYPLFFFFKKTSSLNQSSVEPSVATGSNAAFVPGVQGPECPGNFPGDSINPKNSWINQKRGKGALRIQYWRVFLLFSCYIMSESLRPHGLQHPRLPCPSLSPGVCSNSCPLSQWRDTTVVFITLKYILIEWYINSICRIMKGFIKKIIWILSFRMSIILQVKKRGTNSIPGGENKWIKSQEH